jgi:uncharacterized membrane protein YeaQ/YmgE (transglycosylase-associated protein family)
MASSVLGWIFIGLGASLAGCIWAFRRGVIGVLINMAVAIAGAVTTAWIGSATGLMRSHKDPVGLALAAFGAVVALFVLHALFWQRHSVDGRMKAFQRLSR